MREKNPTYPCSCGRELVVLFESLHYKCFHCGRAGHVKDLLDEAKTLAHERDVARGLCRFAWQGRSVLPHGTFQTRQVIFLEADIEAMTERIKSWFGEDQWDAGLLAQQIVYPAQEAADDEG